MGLDVTAYKDVKVITEQQYDAAHELGGDGKAGYAHGSCDFPGRGEGLVADDSQAHFAYEDSQHCFSAGYGRYSGFRDALALMLGFRGNPNAPRHSFMATPTYAACITGSGPFWEMIAFSDCEGVLGPVVCRKLAQDFVQYDAEAHAGMTEEHYRWYAQIREGFVFAGENGCMIYG